MPGTAHISRSALPRSGPLETLLWILGRRRRLRVVGESMLPHLKPGDELLLDPRAFAHRLPRQGEVVVARHPFRGDVLVIKRVMRADSDGGGVTLAGDNPEASTDSRAYGSVPMRLVLGRVSSILA